VGDSPSKCYELSNSGTKLSQDGNDWLSLLLSSQSPTLFNYVKPTYLVVPIETYTVRIDLLSTGHLVLPCLKLRFCVLQRV
jgi:hypothetical protein